MLPPPYIPPGGGRWLVVCVVVEVEVELVGSVVVVVSQPQSSNANPNKAMIIFISFYISPSTRPGQTSDPEHARAL